jgi:hypothetical protein
MRQWGESPRTPLPCPGGRHHLCLPASPCRQLTTVHPAPRSQPLLTPALCRVFHPQRGLPSNMLAGRECPLCWQFSRFPLVPQGGPSPTVFTGMATIWDTVHSLVFPKHSIMNSIVSISSKMSTLIWGPSLEGFSIRSAVTTDVTKTYDFQNVLWCWNGNVTGGAQNIALNSGKIYYVRSKQLPHSSFLQYIKLPPSSFLQYIKLPHSSFLPHPFHIIAH